MYMTLWTLRVSPLYVYRHFTLCSSPALDSIYYTLHVLDSMFIVTLCLSSIIIYVLLSMASYRRTRSLGYAGTVKVAYGFYVYLHSMFIVTSLCVCHPHSTLFTIPYMYLTLCLS